MNLGIHEEVAEELFKGKDSGLWLQDGVAPAHLRWHRYWGTSAEQQGYQN